LGGLGVDGRIILKLTLEK